MLSPPTTEKSQILKICNLYLSSVVSAATAQKLKETPTTAKATPMELHSFIVSSINLFLFKLRYPF